jgi:hypothetical protein
MVAEIPVSRSGFTRLIGRFLLLPLLAIALPGAAVAESGNYRIEVLIFNHLESEAIAGEVDELRSFSRFMPLNEVQGRPAPLLLDVMSAAMQDSWRRLRLSATYRPLLFAAWEQSRIDYHPPVRLHDEEKIAEHLQFPHRVAFVDLRSPDMFADYLAPYYRLDGTVQLIRSRFLHLNLDLEFRQSLATEPAPYLSAVAGAGRNPAVADRIRNGAVKEDQSAPAFSALAFTDLELIRQPQLTEARYPGPGPALVHSDRAGAVFRQPIPWRTGQGYRHQWRIESFDCPAPGQ